MLISRGGRSKQEKEETESTERKRGRIAVNKTLLSNQTRGQYWFPVTETRATRIEFNDYIFIFIC